MLATSNSPRFRYTLFSDLLGPLVLRHDPVGWENLGITIHRDAQAHGCTTQYSAQLSFVKEGRAYLARAYEAAGIEADVQVGVEQLEPNAFRFLPYYLGRVNFTAAEFTTTFAKVNVEQQNFLQKFLARNSVKVDLLAGTSVSGAAGPVPTPLPVELHSRAVLQRYAASQQAARTDTGQMYGDEDDASHEQLFYLGLDTPEVNDFGLGAVGGGFVAGEARTAVPIYTAKEFGVFLIELAIYARVEAHVTNGPDFSEVDRAWHFRINGDPATATRLLPDFSSGGYNGDYEEEVVIPPFSVSVTLAIGDSIYLYGDYFMHGIGGAATGIRYRATLSAVVKPGSYLRITATTQTPATTTQGLLLYEAFARLSQALTDELDVFRSDFLGRPDTSPAYAADGEGALTLLTGGFQVRGFPLLSSPAPASGLDLRKTLFTTWQELYDSAAAAYALGWGVQWVPGTSGQPVEVVRVEHFSFFYPADLVLDLTDAGPLEVTRRVATADHYQVAEVGYEQWQAEQLGGLDEFNSKRQFTTPLTRVDGTYSQLSKVAASGILLEATRRDRFDATATTDTSQDATNFFVCLLRESAGGFETERNQRALLLTGLNSPATCYNLPLSPARMLDRHGPVLRAGLLPTATATVRYTSGEGNTGVTSQLLGEARVFQEGGDVLVRDLPAPRWRGEQDSFTAPVSRERLRQLLARPTGRVRYLNDRGVPCEGWILDFTHHITEQTGDFTLRVCAA